MKKIFKISFIFLFIFMLCFTGCKKKTKCDKKGHEWVEATCTTPKHCNICNLEEGTTIPHTEVVDEGYDATCTKSGLTQGSHCLICNEVLKAQVEIKALGHTEVVDEGYDATCTKSGLTQGSHCLICNEVLKAQVEIKALGHTEVIDAKKDATCTESGLTEGSHCSVCDEVIVAQVEIKALGHTEVIDAAIDATCTESGLTEGKHCSVCNEVLKAQEEIKALGHTEVIDEGYDATCAETGLTEGSHCSVCNEVIKTQEVIEKAEHTWIDATYYIPKTCKVCGLTEGEPLTKPTSIYVESNSIAVYMGETIKLTHTVLPNSVNQEVKYSMTKAEGGDGTISDDGTFTAISEGYVYIRISSKELTYVSTTITIQVLHPLLEDVAYDVFNVMTGYGTDASTEVEINYHTRNIYTSVEYTLASDVDFNNITVVTGEGYYFTEGTDKVTIPFIGRNVMRVSLTGLTPDTDYMYRINKGDGTYSDTYYFSTAKNDGSDSAFIVLADTHYHAQTAEDGSFKSHGSEISEGLIEKILEYNSNVDFIATAGDIVDTGGNANTWSVFFEHSTSLKQMVRVGVAGNHEYYISGTGQSDGRYQKAHYATVNNGPSTQLGLSSYFVYNDILMILIDNENGLGRLEMMEWLEWVLENVEHRYSIAIMHTPIYYEEHETSNKDRDEKLMGVFEKYSVDLVMAGHYHGNRVRYNYYEGQTSTDPYLGVNYMSLTISGVKSRSEDYLACGYLVETHDGTITVKYIDENGKLLATYSFATKKEAEKVEETNENLLASINGVYDETNKTYTINMSNKFYGNVEKLEVEETLRGEISQYIVFPTPSYNKLVIKNVNKFYQYKFKVTVHFNDGTKEEVLLELDLATPINLQATNVTSSSIKLSFNASDEEMLYMIEDYVVYVNGVKYGTFNYLDNRDNPVTSYTINGLNSNTEYEIKFVAMDYSYNKKQLYEYSIIVKTN